MHLTAINHTIAIWPAEIGKCCDVVCRKLRRCNTILEKDCGIVDFTQYKTNYEGGECKVCGLNLKMAAYAENV